MASTFKGQSGMRFLPWLLALILILVAGAYLLYANKDKAKDAAETVTTEMETTTPSTATITPSPLSDLPSFLSSTSLAAQTGSQVDFSNATVTRVTGDRTFAVGSGSNQVYVLLSPSLDAGTA